MRIQSAVPARPVIVAPSLTPEKASAARSVDAFADKLQIPFSAKTDPALLDDILKNDMHLDSPAVRAKLGPLLTEPQALRPMLEQIRAAIVDTQPALAKMLEQALARNLIAEPKDRAEVMRVLNHMFLLSALVRSMNDDLGFANTVVAELRTERKRLGLNTPWGLYRATGGAFEVVKAYSIDAAMTQLLAMRRKQPSGYETDVIRSVQLDANIVEAMLTEKAHGFRDNAEAGRRLLDHDTFATRVSGDGSTVQMSNSREWVSDYEAWNLAFILGNLKHEDLLLPKLLIPEVIGAAPEDYINNRLLALWLTIQFYTFAEAERDDSPHIDNQRELSELLGSINAE